MLDILAARDLVRADLHEGGEIRFALRDAADRLRGEILAGDATRGGERVDQRDRLRVQRRDDGALTVHAGKIR